jgi:hypothetical protein
MLQGTEILLIAAYRVLVDPSLVVLKPSMLLEMWIL